MLVKEPISETMLTSAIAYSGRRKFLRSSAAVMAWGTVASRNSGEAPQRAVGIAGGASLAPSRRSSHVSENGKA